MRLLNHKVLILLLLLTAFLGGCGYYFPNVYNGPARTIYMPNWKNRTSELDLNAKIYQSLSRWFQKSKSLHMTKDKNEADLILAGEIMYIDLPSISWSGNARTTEVRVKLGVRYILKDRKSGDVLWEVPNELWTENYSTESGSAVIADREREALSKIISDLSERIYLGTLNKLRAKDIKAKARADR